MIENLDFSLLDVLNKVQRDKFGCVSAFLAINKPLGMTSHDVVDRVRRILGTRNVGHVGALDPYASGVVLILVGKKYTRMSINLMELDKSYRAKIAFGITTDSLDVEGKVTGWNELKDFDFENLKNTYQEFRGGYDQYVPIFSSVKVGGEKLRILARSAKSFEIVETEGVRKGIFKFDGDKEKVVPIPFKSIDLDNLEYLSDGYVSSVDLGLNTDEPAMDIPFAEVEFHCSKGTYVRQFAYDLSMEACGSPGMLIGLMRTRIGGITLDKCVSLEELAGC